MLVFIKLTFIRIKPLSIFDPLKSYKLSKNAGLPPHAYISNFGSIDPLNRTNAISFSMKNGGDLCAEYKNGGHNYCKPGS